MLLHKKNVTAAGDRRKSEGVKANHKPSYASFLMATHRKRLQQQKRGAASRAVVRVVVAAVAKQNKNMGQKA